MYNREFTLGSITDLKLNEIFVFGSNLAGSHGGGAARLAYNCFGAIWGQGVGLQGHSNAIPTMQGGVEAIKSYVDEFIRFAQTRQDHKFFVTQIGCGIAGYKVDEIAPLFRKFGHDVDNERVYFYNANVEVDFYVPEEELAVQVSYSLADESTKKREVDTLSKLPNVHPCKRRVIVTYDEEDTITDKHGIIEISRSLPMSTILRKRQ